MKDTAKKVVILNNLSSPYICEAIIVLNEYNPQLEGKVIAEAEKIVSDYMERMKKNEQVLNRPAAKVKKSLVFCLAAAIITIAVLGYKAFWG